MLHDCGVLINRKSAPPPRRISHPQRENSRFCVAGRKNMTACPGCAYHNRKSEPSTAHSVFRDTQRGNKERKRGSWPVCCAWPERLESDQPAGPFPNSPSRAGPRDVRIHVGNAWTLRGLEPSAGIERKAPASRNGEPEYAPVVSTGAGWLRRRGVRLMMHLIL